MSITDTDVATTTIDKKNIYLSRYLRPERFDIEPGGTASDTRWAHWRYTFINFLSEELPDEVPDSIKLKLLINHLSPTVYSFIQDCKSYEIAIRLLDEIYDKPKNEIHARHILATRRQQSGETIAEYIRCLKQLAHDCNFKSVTAEQNRNEYIRDAFIAGISCHNIRQRLLENLALTLDEAQNQAISLETAKMNSLVYINNHPMQLHAVESSQRSKSTLIEENQDLAAASTSSSKCRRCFFCGSSSIHRRIKCPAFNATCQICAKKGHFANVCRSNKLNSNAVVSESTTNTITESATISAASPSSLRKATVPIKVNDVPAEALIDTGSSVSFINKRLAQDINLEQKPYKQAITLASLSHISFVEGICFATIKLDEHIYKQQPLLIVNQLCADIIIGHDLLKNHKTLEFNFGGPRDTLKVCVMQASVPPASLFTNLSPNITPIAIKSRRYSKDDEEFIREEISKLLEDGVIEPSTSPWRAQVLVTGGTTHRKRLVIDYSLTINKYTELDAYPLPNIDSIVTNVAKYNFFSQIDLKSAYHQVPILQTERKYTAFEACGALYQFTRIPFGVTNGVAAFQRTLQYLIQTENLEGTFAYLDDVTICGKNKEDHDKNLQRFMNIVKKYGLTLNEKKCIFGSTLINLLGYTIENNNIRPDKERLKPLLDLPVPTDTASLKRALGMLAHYSKWVNNFSNQIKPLIGITHFPLSNDAKNCFESLKGAIAKASLVAISDNETFTVETDASEYAIAATLSQNSRPVAFFSRTLTDSERRHSSIEKEANAIVESLRKWRHYLMGRHFILITDQQSVAFMFGQKHSSKIKNEKIERWRLELSSYKYDIIYRPGRENIVADALSRVCAYMNTNKLYNLHNQLCHPGVTRMLHWVRSKNLPYSINEIKSMTTSCPICAEIKPRFFRTQGHLIKAIAPFERLNIDFKGPLPSNTQNKYILTIIDEYSRFPFAYPCKDLTAATVIKCLEDLFFTFGFPLYIHSDRGATFMSDELKKFLITLGIASSRTTPYNPQGNGQVERLNGTLWRTIKLNLRSKNMDTPNWEQALPIALHSIRSLLCTSTNATPHERMFQHSRRSPNGESLPTWLLNPGPVLIKKNVRMSKYDPLIEEVELLQANPSYSHVRFFDGRESTVSNRQLAPLPLIQNCTRPNETEDSQESNVNCMPPETSNGNEITVQSEEQTPSNPLRRSTRERQTPAYLRDYIVE